MELREYIQIIFKHLRLIVVFTMAAFTLTMVISYNATPVYESISSFVTGIDCSKVGGGTDECVYAFDALTGRQRIFVTNCDIMESTKVRKIAFAMLGVNLDDPLQAEGYGVYTVDCTVLPESQVQLLVVQGTDPNTVYQLNQAVGAVGIQEISRGFPIYPITVLDSVELLEDPVSPNHIFNGILGVAFGLMVSVTMVLLLDYLRTPQEKLENISIYDPRINVYNSRYLQRRLKEEIQRSRMQHRLLAVALVHLTPDENFLLLAEDDQELLLRKAAERMKGVFRETDIIAYRGNNTFGVMMPETSEQDALMLFKKLHEIIREEPVETERYGYIINFTATTGLVENNGGTLEMYETMEVVLDALQKAMSSGVNSIEFVRTKASAFVVDETELEHVHYNLTGAGDELFGGLPPALPGGGDPHKTQPLPPLSSVTGTLIDGEYNADGTPVVPAAPMIMERTTTYQHDDDDEFEDTEENPDEDLATREERRLKERLVKRIRERQAKKR